MAHFSVWQRSPFKNNFMPSRRHSRQTGPMYLAIRSDLPLRKGAVYNPEAFVLLPQPAKGAAAPSKFREVTMPPRSALRAVTCGGCAIRDAAWGADIRCAESASGL